MKKLIFCTLKVIEIGLILASCFLWKLFYDWTGLTQYIYEMSEIVFNITGIILLLIACIIIYLFFRYHFKSWIKDNKNLTDKIYKRLNK